MNQFVHHAEIRDFRFVFDKCGPMWASVPTNNYFYIKKTPTVIPSELNFIQKESVFHQLMKS